MRFKSTLLLALILSVLLTDCSSTISDKLGYNIHKKAVSSMGMVVSAHPLASEVGTNILKQGGNAIDAAIAVQLALAVVYPAAGNIGGGGFMVITDQKGQTVTLDFREKAPSAANRDLYLDSKGDVIEGLSTSSHLAVGVPGTVDGIFTIFEKYSKLKNFDLLIKPAIELAANGYKITSAEANDLNYSESEFKRLNKYAIPFVKSTAWKQGDVLKQTDLAETLQRIMKNGRSEFYEGKTAEMLVKCISENKGIITLDDLKKYKSVWRKPIAGHYRGYTILSMAPPSSGGVLLLQMLKMLEPYDLKTMGFQSKQYIHLLTEVQRRSYADRSVYLGDPAFVKIPVHQLLDSMYLLSRMKNFNPLRAIPSKLISAGTMPLPHESEETTHISIIDKDGNAVSITTTLNSSYGSNIVVNGAGFILNNEMDDFSIKPGNLNQYGLIGAEANAIQPGKRMLSSMTPTVVMKDGKIFAVVGSPGGSTIITTVLQVLVNLIDHKMDPYDAVQAGRFHSQWLPDKIYVENGLWSKQLTRQLEEMGHAIESRTDIGRVEAIVRNMDGTYIGIADKRGDDDVEVVK